MFAEIQPILIFSFLAALMVMYVRSTGRFWWWASASNLSIGYFAAILLATYLFPRERSRHVTEWTYIVFAGTVSLIAGCLAASTRKGVKTRDLAEKFYNRPMETEITRTTLVIFALITITGVMVIGIYLTNLGGNVLVQSTLKGIDNVSTVDMVQIRKDAVYGQGYGSGDYTAAGYIMQFRSLLLPMIFLACFVSFLTATGYKTFILVIGAVAIVACTLANGATGQRYALVIPFVLLTYLSFARYYSAPDSIPSNVRGAMHTVGVVSLALGFVFFAILTLALGRQERATSLSDQVADISYAGFNRLFIIPAQTDLMSVEILKDYPPSFGEQWARIVLMPLPASIENEITKHFSPVGTSTWLHVEHGGSYEGNAPLDRWGSLWFNFRLPGVIIIGFISGYLVHCYDRWCYRWRKTPLGIVCWQVGGISVATAPSPGYLLLTGFAAAMILAWLARISSPQSPPSGQGSNRNEIVE